MTGLRRWKSERVERVEKIILNRIMNNSKENKSQSR